MDCCKLVFHSVWEGERGRSSEKRKGEGGRGGGRGAKQGGRREGRSSEKRESRGEEGNINILAHKLICLCSDVIGKVSTHK